MPEAADVPRGFSLKPRTWWFGLALLVLVGIPLRAWHLGSQSLWFDEARFLEAALQPDPSSLVRFMIVEDYHPPLYPLVLRGWVAVFGTSDAAVRALPALIGLALIPLTAWLTLLLSGNRSASLVAAGFISLGGYHLYLSQEGRHYTWLAAVGCLNIIAFVQVLHFSRKRWLTMLGLSALIGSLSHYYMLLVAVGEIAFAARARVHLRGTLLVVLTASVMIFVLVWGGPFVEQGKLRAAWGEGLMEPLTGPFQAAGFVVQSVYWTVVDFSLGRPILLLGAPGFDWPDLFKSAALLGIVALGVAGLLHLRRDRSDLPFSLLGLVAAVGALPIALAIASSLTEAMIYDTKYVSFAAPLWAAAVGTGLATIRNRWLGRALLTVTLAALCGSALEFHLEAIPWKEDWRSAADLVEGNWQQGDVVLQRAPYTAFCLDHYLGWSPRRLTSPGTFLVPEESVEPVLGELRSSGGKRLWVVNSHDEHGAALRELLAERLREGPTWPFRGITITLYEAGRDSSAFPQ